jgi:SAM-dependent methyltransferase
LGGNIAELDPASYCPTSWEYVINKYSIKSVLDVGSGRGHAGKYFKDFGLEVTAIEGLKENVEKSLIPTIEHDLTISPYTKDVDMVNCVEVVEHIEEKYLDNLLTTICCGKILFMTHAVPGQGGYHHVNEQPSEYWINHLKNRNFEYLENDSMQIRELSKKDNAKHITRTGMLFKKL